jgi:hypothetical protein
MTDCIEWQGARRRHDYGYLVVRGRQILAHRWVWEQAHGPIPPGLCILHRCDNPPCVRLDHLWLGTKGDNARDRHAKGRDSHAPRGDKRGERNGRAKVTEADVRRIRGMYEDAVPVSDIAREYGLRKGAVYCIVSRRSWSHIR